MQLLGLLWAGGPASERARLARGILDKQRPDGGWAQTDNLQSDAYATGVSLSALAEAGGVVPTHAAYKKGVQYLLSTQRADGSWYVKSRAPKFQPFFDGDSLTATISGFPRWQPDGRPRRWRWRFRKIGDRRSAHRPSSIGHRLVDMILFTLALSMLLALQQAPPALLQQALKAAPQLRLHAGQRPMWVAGDFDRDMRPDVAAVVRTAAGKPEFGVIAVHASVRADRVGDTARCRLDRRSDDRVCPRRRRPAVLRRLRFQYLAALVRRGI